MKEVNNKITAIFDTIIEIITVIVLKRFLEKEPVRIPVHVRKDRRF